MKNKVVRLSFRTVTLSRTYDYCKEKGVMLEMINIHGVDEGRQGRFGHTDDQQTTLILAF